MKGTKWYIKIILYTVFLKTILVRGKWTITLVITRHNSGSTLRIFLKSLQVKQGKRSMKIIITIFLKKILVRAKLVILDLKMACPYLKIERDQKVHESYINCFSYKIVLLSGKKGRAVMIPNDTVYINVFMAPATCEDEEKYYQPSGFHTEFNENLCLCYNVYIHTYIYIYIYIYIYKNTNTHTHIYIYIY